MKPVFWKLFYWIMVFSVIVCIAGSIAMDTIGDRLCGWIALVTIMIEIFRYNMDKKKLTKEQKLLVEIRNNLKNPVTPDIPSDRLRWAGTWNPVNAIDDLLKYRGKK